MNAVTPDGRSGRRPGVLDWMLVGLLTALAGVFGVFGVFFLPAYRGSVPLPISAVVVGAALVVLPRVGYLLTQRMLAALAPVLVWLVVTLGLYVLPNALYLQVPVAWRGWQFGLLFGIGALAAATSVGAMWGDQLRAEVQRQPVDESRR